MLSGDKYEYMSDASLNDLLTCKVCTEYLNDPMSTPCEHVFCRQCIKTWLETHSSCPECRQNSLLDTALKPTERIVVQMLDRLEVKCKECGQTNLARGNFNDHIEKMCVNSTTACPSADFKCPWKGQRAQLNDHIATCIFEPARLMFTEVSAKNRELKERIQQLEANTQSQRDTCILTNQQLTQLDTTNANPLNATGSSSNAQRTFREIIDTNGLLSDINLDRKNLFDVDMEYVIQQGIINKQCKKLRLSVNEISSEGVSALANAMRSSPPLEELYLDCNRVSDLGAQLLAQAISDNNTNLKVLYLGSNGITHVGAHHLAEMLKTNQTLCRLNLSDNNIGDQGVQLLVNALNGHNRSLIHLDLNSNKLESDSTVDSLIDMLKYNHSLKQLRVCNCNLSESSKIRLQDAAKLKQHFTLRI